MRPLSLLAAAAILALSASPALAQQRRAAIPPSGGSGGSQTQGQGGGQSQGGQGGGGQVRSGGGSRQAQSRPAERTAPRTSQREDGGGDRRGQSDRTDRPGIRNEGRARPDPTFVQENPQAQRREDARPRGQERVRGGIAVPRPQGRRPGPSPRIVYAPAPRIYNYYSYPRYTYSYPRSLYPYGYGAFGLGYFYYDPYRWHPRYSGSVYYQSGGGAYRGYDVGELRLDVSPRDAEVWVDGFFAGVVDDFDGAFQSLRLEAGGYRIEIVAPGYEPLVFDVRISPGRKTTYRGDLRRF